MSDLYSRFYGWHGESVTGSFIKTYCINFLWTVSSVFSKNFIKSKIPLRLNWNRKDTKTGATVRHLYYNRVYEVCQDETSTFHLLPGPPPHLQFYNVCLDGILSTILLITTTVYLFIRSGRSFVVVDHGFLFLTPEGFTVCLVINFFLVYTLIIFPLWHHPLFGKEFIFTFTTNIYKVGLLPRSYIVAVLSCYSESDSNTQLKGTLGVFVRY